MLSRAHVGAGVAAALAVVRPVGAASCVICALGAAAGSLICDIDVRASERERDAFRVRMAVLALLGALLAYDYGRGGPVCTYVMDHFGTPVVAGAAGFLLTCVVGSFSPHRSFAHSLVALALWSGSLEMLCPPLVVPFSVGVASHLLLDVTNKRGLRLFWPFRTEVSLGLWRSDGPMNNLVAGMGLLVAIVLFAQGLAGA